MAEQVMPYERATSGAAAREEVVRILRRFGCESVGYMDDFANSKVLLQFTWRGNRVSFEASAAGWANAYMRNKPYTSRTRGTKADYERRVLNQGLIAVDSILRDWVKGQMTAVECGIMSFADVIMPYVLLPDGRRLIDHAQEKLLPPPQKSKDD